ncbi:hypothetical protein [Mesorhizobium sp. A623]
MIIVAATSPETPEVPEVPEEPSKSYVQIEMNGGWIYECETDLTVEGVSGERYDHVFDVGGPIAAAFDSIWLSNVGTLDWGDFDSSKIFGNPWDDVENAEDFDHDYLRIEFSDFSHGYNVCITPFALVTSGTIGTGQGVGYAGGSVVEH